MRIRTVRSAAGSRHHQDRSDGQDNTFSVLFPLGHAYWGLIDNLSGQNLNDYSVQLAVQPTKSLTVASAMHWFDLERDTDVLYNLAGAPLGTAGTGSEIGEEFDFVATYVFNPNFNVQLGALWFWNGTFVVWNDTSLDGLATAVRGGAGENNLDAERNRGMIT